MLIFNDNPYIQGELLLLLLLTISFRIYIFWKNSVKLSFSIKIVMCLAFWIWILAFRNFLILEMFYWFFAIWKKNWFWTLWFGSFRKIDWEILDEYLLNYLGPNAAPKFHNCGLCRDRYRFFIFFVAFVFFSHVFINFLLSFRSGLGKLNVVMIDFFNYY